MYRGSPAESPRDSRSLFNAVLSLFPANEIVSNLDEGDLNTALQAGGTVTFSLDGTITLTNTITLSNNVILDGANHSITISVGGAVTSSCLSPATANFAFGNALDNCEASAVARIVRSDSASVAGADIIHARAL